VTGRQGRRCKKLLDDLNERRGYCHLKEQALDRTMWRARFGRDFGPVVRQTTKLMKILSYTPLSTMHSTISAHTACKKVTLIQRSNFEYAEIFGET
jgi:hypothetical protein